MLMKVYFTQNSIVINYSQWIAFVKYLYKQLKWAIVEKLLDGWKEFEAEISNSFEEFSKNYYVVFE